MKILTQTKLKEILNYNESTGIFTWKISRGNRRINNIAGCTQQEYVIIRINNKNYKAHRLTWLYIYGEFPKQEIDHINHKKDDNRLCNLREATRLENGRNMVIYKSNKSGIPGVFWYNGRKKWVVHIKVNGKNKHIGYFKDLEDAKEARKEAKIRYGYHKNHG